MLNFVIFRILRLPDLCSLFTPYLDLYSLCFNNSFGFGKLTYRASIWYTESHENMTYGVRYVGYKPREIWTAWLVEASWPLLIVYAISWAVLTLFQLFFRHWKDDIQGFNLISRITWQDAVWSEICWLQNRMRIWPARLVAIMSKVTRSYLNFAF